MNFKENKSFLRMSNITQFDTPCTNTCRGPTWKKKSQAKLMAFKQSFLSFFFYKKKQNKNKTKQKTHTHNNQTDKQNKIKQNTLCKPECIYYIWSPSERDLKCSVYST